MRGFLLGLALLLLGIGVAWAGLQFPPLTGRVVDQAQLLPAATQATLTQKLAALEQSTGDQLVVVTIPSLQNTSIEDYGFQLGRFWGIGQKDKNNGVLLIVAPTERKVRIEVGYGLEATLTDFTAKNIIDQIIVPDFRKGDMAGGIVDGTDALVRLLTGDIPAAPPAATAPNASAGLSHAPVFLVIAIAVLGLCALLSLVFTLFEDWGGSRRYGGFWGDFWYNFGQTLNFILLMFLSGSRSGSGSGSSDSGFSGGGGSFGGGGASGGW